MFEDFKEFGLIGNNLKNSFSKNYFTDLFLKKNLNYKYSNFELTNINELPDLLLKNTDLCGLNVTIPFKESVISYLDKLDETAQNIDAVNCIKIERFENKIFLTGHNTDAIGFEVSLLQLIPKNFDSKALILGNGGASKAIQYVLKKLSIEYVIVSTKKNDHFLNYEYITKEIIESHLLIINTTPLGMYPNEEETPNIPFHYLTINHYCFDLVYLPSETLFMKKSALNGAKTINGLKMLEEQANQAFDIFIK